MKKINLFFCFMPPAFGSYKNFKTVFIAALIFFSFAVPNLTKAEKNPAQTFSLHLEKNKIYTNSNSTNLLLHQKLGQQNVNVLVATESNTSFSLIDTADEIFILEVFFNKLVVSMHTPQTTVQFSSASRKKNMMSEFFYLLTQHPFKVKIDSQGKVLEMENTLPVLEKVFQNFSTLSKEQKYEMRKIFEDSFAGDAFKKYFSDSLDIFPQTPIRIGESWKKNITEETKNKLLITKEITYTLKRANRKFLFLDVHEEVKTISDREESESILRYELEGNSKGKIKIDKQSRWILNSDLEMLLKGHAYGTGVSENVPDNIKSPAFIFSEQKSRGKIKKR